MRYYLYVSTSKLDMLYEQIPPKLLRRLAVEAKVDLKVLSLSVQSPRATEAGTYDRLDIVETYLEREFDVGWMSEPTPWFRGELGLRIAGYADPGGPTFMAGRAGDTLVALIGSGRHLIGYRAADDMAHIGHSGVPSLFRLLQDLPDHWAPFVGPGGAPPPEAYVVEQVRSFSERLTVPPVHCDFLARRLMRGSVTLEDGRRQQVVIGTPLYVAMADEAPDEAADLGGAGPDA